jgi:hypothetical protein
MKYVLPRRACHNSTVSPRRLSKAGVLAFALASFGCRKSGVECVPPPVVACPDGGGPSFEGDVLPIFHAVCDNCHAPDGSPPQTPFLTNYQQIYGPTSGPNAGSEIGTFYTYVFELCAMPPANATVPLSDEQRQILLDWYVCGAPDSPALDAGTGD